MSLQNLKIRPINALIELYKRGDYDRMPLYDKQKQALKNLTDQTTTETLYGGGARGGKSWLGNFWVILECLTYPESPTLIAREELTKLTDTTQRTFFKTCKFLGLRINEDYKFNSQKNITEFRNGSVIFWREIKYTPSDPEFDRLGSYDLTRCFLDEAQQIHWKAREVLRGRLSILDGEGWKHKPKALFTCNPAKNWIYSDFVKPSNNNTITSDKVFVPALATDNESVGQDYIDNLMRADEVTRQRLLFGNFEYDDDPAAMVDYDSICDMFTNTHVKPGGEKRISSDLAMQGRDRFVTGSWDGFVVTIDLDKEKCTAKQIEEDLKSLKEQRGVSNTHIVADSDGLGAYLESYIENIKEFHGGASAKDKDNYFNLKSECAFKLAELINNKNIYVICTKEQEEEIKSEISICLKRYKVDSDETKKRILPKDKMKELLGHSPDYMDMLIMGMFFHVKKEIEVWAI